MLSSPSGYIDCGSGKTDCTEPFDAGTHVTLTATAASSFHFAGWSGDCTGSGTCSLNMGADHAVTATFAAVECRVPKVKGEPLAAAQKAIRRAHCSVGKIQKVRSATVKNGSVISQKPVPRTILPEGSKVSLKVSKGKKP